MIANSINTKTTFKGYKNLFSNNIDLGNNLNFSFIGMELNNEKSNDLETWLEIQKLINPNKKPSNNIIFHCFSENNNLHFSLGEHKLNLDNTETIPENVMIKIYTFMASLTRNIINSKYSAMNNNTHLTLCEILQNLNKIFKNEQLTHYITADAAFGRINNKEVAQNFNQKIALKMKKYFKTL